MPTPSIRDTLAFVRSAHAGARVDGKPRWMRSLEVMGLLPQVLPGIKVTHADRQVALLRDVLETAATTERALLRAGFPEAVVDGVVRLSRFDPGCPHLDHLRAVAASRDLSAMRAAMADLLHEDEFGRAARGPDGTGEAAEARGRRAEAMAILARGLGCRAPPTVPTTPVPATTAPAATPGHGPAGASARCARPAEVAPPVRSRAGRGRRFSFRRIVSRMYAGRRGVAEKEGNAVGTMTMVQGISGAEAGPIPRFRRRGARSWAVPAVAALHWAAVACLAVASIGAGFTLWLG